ncbi:MAG: 50S ribosomal protein L17 [Candidatus Shapirobacteria bacterium]
MRHLKKRKKLSRNYDQRRALKKNLVRDLFLHGKIKTTLTRARVAVSLAERIIARLKRNDLSGRRFAFSLFGDEKFVNQIAKDILPRFQKNEGGITRQRKLARRRGDNALLVMVEFIDGQGGVKKEIKKNKDKKIKKETRKQKDQVKKEKKK